ncbi:MAG: tRNA pseudouridine(38-40) synthase TruA [Alphaproteobacteria bacterium]|nr:tRNA pseudouridine(38-40) synthase TruA [Alphaproteobacteria bacterium]
MRCKLTIEYDGTGYHGWQRQDDLPTIQGAIEEAVFQFSQVKTEVYGSGRTDAGVHALGQVAHVDLPKEYPLHKIQMGLNFYLKDEGIRIVSVENTSGEFHARFDAKKRHYLYRVLNRFSESALDKNRVWWVPQDINLEAMKMASKFLIGRHDFSAFRASECQAESPVRTLDNIQIEKVNDEIHFHVSARSFLHHQVRNFVGSLIEIGQGKYPPEWIKEVLESLDRTKAGVSAPACGLYFEKVLY